MVHQNYAIKSIGHCACSRAKDHRASLPGPWIEREYHVLEMHVCSFPLVNVQYRMHGDN